MAMSRGGDWMDMRPRLLEKFRKFDVVLKV
jgi:hypothetical protein